MSEGGAGSQWFARTFNAGSKARRVVHRVEDGMDRQEIEATTYQMRNPFKQLRDGYFTTLDVFNYLHHHWIAKTLAKPGDLVLDVCCGRGIMLPLLRYHAPEIAGYVGVDLEPGNAEWVTRRVTDGKPLTELQGGPQTADSYYPFPTLFVEANAATMVGPINDAWEWDVPSGFTLIIYTQSIEHMHPGSGWASLEQCAQLAAPGCRLILSGPNTPRGQSGYETRYRAHVYEWKRSELQDALADTGWDLQDEWGLTLGKTELAESMERAGLAAQWKRLSTSVPTEWLVPVLAPLFPEASSEIAMLAIRQDGQLRLGE